MVDVVAYPKREDFSKQRMSGYAFFLTVQVLLI